MLGIKSKAKVKKYAERHPIEAISEELLGIGTGIKSSVQKDFIDEGKKDFLEQLLKVEKKFNKLAGDLNLGEEVDIASLSADNDEAAKPSADITPGIDYGKEYTREVLHYQEQSSRLESSEIEQRVGEIMVELKKLVDTSAVLEAEFRQVTTEQAPVIAGKYHLNFFEWMLGVIRSARERIEDSGSWLHAISSKKGKQQYWAMFKKHGTNFGLSNERVVATQTG